MNRRDFVEGLETKYLFFNECVVAFVSKNSKILSLNVCFSPHLRKQIMLRPIGCSVPMSSAL